MKSDTKFLLIGIATCLIFSGVGAWYGWSHFNTLFNESGWLDNLIGAGIGAAIGEFVLAMVGTVGLIVFYIIDRHYQKQNKQATPDEEG